MISAQPPQDFDRAEGVGHDHALGDLQGEMFGVERVTLEKRRDDIGKAGVDQCLRREVHRHSNGDPIRQPMPTLAERIVKDPDGEGMYQARLLRESDERGRRQQPTVRWFHRTSASTATTWRLARSTCGW